MNWYNEIDAYAAEWLENLIAAGHIPDGYVDRRSISEVSPDDLIGFDQCHFFAGIGGWPLALRLAGVPDDRPVWTGSCPCQPFSAAGKRKGIDDARHLWPEFRRLIAAHRPYVIFGEQVASSDGRAWLGGQPGLQRVQDREAIIGVLQGRDLLGRLPDSLQAMLLRGRGGAQGTCAEGEEERRLQEVAAAESRGCPGSSGAPSCESEGAALHVGPEGGSGGDRFRGVPDDGDTVQPGRRSDVGQPFSGQDRQLEGLHPGECSRGALLHQRDGEHMGREQDSGDRGSDHGTAAECVGVFAGEAGIRVEAAAEFRELAGVRADLEALGYACGGADLCAAGVGAPHIRQRLWWSAVCEGGEADRSRVADCTGPGRRPERENIHTANCDQEIRAGETEPGRCRPTGRLADSDSRGPSQGRQAASSPRQRCAAIADGGSERVEHAAGDRRQQRRAEPGGRGTERGCGTGGLGNADQPGPQGRGVLSERGDERAAWSPGLDGFWSDFDLTPCADGKARRTQPGLQPLAHGVSARVGKLRAYGNAIVPPLAAEFIRACLEGDVRLT